MASRAKEIRRAVEDMKSKNSTRSGVLDDCARFGLPRDKDISFQTSDDGHEKPQPISSRMANGVDRFTGWLYSNTVGSLSDLFLLRDMDEDRNKIDTVSKWYSDLTEVLIRSVQNSNFSLSSHEMLFSYVAFGQGFHSAEMDELTGRITNKSYSANGNNWMTVDAEGKPNGFYRLKEFTARQAVEKFGEENLSDELKRASEAEHTAHNLFSFYYVVRRRKERKRELKTMQGKPWEGIWVEGSAKNDKLVEERGFVSFPFQCPRFYAVDGEAHGRGVVHKGMYDVRALQRARHDYFESVESAVKPALVTSDEDAADGFDYRAGSVNIIDDVEHIKEVSSQKSIPAIKDLNEDLCQAVDSACYLDLVNIIDSQKIYQNPQTAELVERQISGILPAYGRLKSEFFEAYVERQIALMIDRDSGLPPEERMIPAPPPEVLREDGSFLFTIAFNTRLDAKIQRLQNSNLLTFYAHASDAAAAYGANPSLDALVPLRKALRFIALNDNVAADLVNSKDAEDDALAKIQQAQKDAQDRELAAKMIKPVDTAAAPQPGSPMAEM